MKTLYLRIYLTVLAVLAAFALVGGGLAKLKLDEERERFDQERSRYEQNASDRTLAWAELIEAVLPPDEAPELEQAAALVSWSERLRLPMALDRADGVRVVTSPLYDRLEDLRHRAERPLREDRGPVRLNLRDGRGLWIWRPPRLLREALGLPGGGPREGASGADRGPGGGPGFGPPPPRRFGGLPPVRRHHVAWPLAVCAHRRQRAPFHPAQVRGHQPQPQRPAFQQVPGLVRRHAVPGRPFTGGQQEVDRRQRLARTAAVGMWRGVGRAEDLAEPAAFRVRRQVQQAHQLTGAAGWQGVHPPARLRARTASRRCSTSSAPTWLLKSRARDFSSARASPPASAQPSLMMAL